MTNAIRDARAAVDRLRELGDDDTANRLAAAIDCFVARARFAEDEGMLRAVAEDDDVYAAFWGYAQGDHSREHVIRVVLAALDRYLASK